MRRAAAREVAQAEQQDHGDGANRDRHEGVNQDFGHRRSLSTPKMVRPSPRFQFPAAKNVPRRPFNSAGFEIKARARSMAASLTGSQRMQQRLSIVGVITFETG